MRIATNSGTELPGTELSGTELSNILRHSIIEFNGPLYIMRTCMWQHLFVGLLYYQNCKFCKYQN